MKRKLVGTILSAVIVCGSFFCGTPSAAKELDLNNEQVTLMVTLNSPSLIEYANDSHNGFGSVTELIMSESGAEYTAAIERSQQLAVREIISGCIDIDMSGSRSFTTVTNGFTLKAPLSEMNTIRSLSCVKNVSAVSVTKTAVKDEADDEESDEDEEYSESNIDYGMQSKINSQITEAYEKGYTGKGMLIAVIDNEFDVHHEIFSVRPPDMRYMKSDIREINERTPFCISEEYNINNVYYNGKIVYAYDYGEDDNKCRMKDSIHGTHVAGIAAGNNGQDSYYPFRGMAYDAQLALFKISKKDGVLSNDAIVAALDDAVKLSPDVINCSYGSVAYLTHESEGRDIYRRIMDSGIALVSSAGNSAFNGYDLGYEMVPADFTSYGTICSPSSMDGALSVGASATGYVYAHPMFMEFNENEESIEADMIYADLTFDDVYPSSDIFTDSINRPEDIEGEYLDTVEYVYLKAQGTADELNGIDADLTDKIVILDQGDISVEQVLKNIVDKRCYAAIILRDPDNEKYTTKTAERDFFIYGIDISMKPYFEENPVGSVSLYTGFELVSQSSNILGELTDYSSYGTLSDLKLKPDIIMTGDEVFSSMPYEEYGTMSGTSMASPGMTGIYAIMKQYLREQGTDLLMSPELLEEYIYELLMSSADLIYLPDESGLCYSPRRQGAGRVNVKAAMNTPVYLTVNNKRPSASLGESTDGVFDFSFTAHNRSDEEHTYKLSSMLQTDGYKKNTDKDVSIEYWNTLIPENIRDKAEISITVNGQSVDSVTVPAGSQTDVNVSIKLNSNMIRERSEIFKNGFMVDGFIILTSQGLDTLSVPFSGFCGQWSSAPIFPDMEPEDAGSVYPTANNGFRIVSAFEEDNYFTFPAGKNYFDYKDLPNIIAFGKDSLRSLFGVDENTETMNCILLPDIYIQRDALDYTISIYKESGELLFCQNFGDIPANFSADTPCDYFQDTDNLSKIQAYADFVETLSEGNYIMELSAYTVGTDGNPDRKETYATKITVDNTRPQIVDYFLYKTKEGGLYLFVQAKDNRCLQGNILYAVQLDGKGEVGVKINLHEDLKEAWEGKEYVQYEYDEASDMYYFVYDLTDYSVFINEKIHEEPEVITGDDFTIIIQSIYDYSMVDENHILIEALDSAGSCSTPRLIDINSYGEAMITFTDADGNPIRGATVYIDGVTYATNNDGLIYIRNLPVAENTLQLTSQFCLENGSRELSFTLSKDKYTLVRSYVLIDPNKDEKDPDEVSDSEDDNTGSQKPTEDKKPSTPSKPEHTVSKSESTVSKPEPTVTKPKPAVSKPKPAAPAKTPSGRNSVTGKTSVTTDTSRIITAPEKKKYETKVFHSFSTGDTENVFVFIPVLAITSALTIVLLKRSGRAQRKKDTISK